MFNPSGKEQLRQAARSLSRAISVAQETSITRRTERALDNQGQVVLGYRDFLPIRSPDGSLWRIRVSDTGVITAHKVVT